MCRVTFNTAKHACKYGINGRRYTKLTLSVDLASKSVVGKNFDGQPLLVPIVMGPMELDGIVRQTFVPPRILMPNRRTMST